MSVTMIAAAHLSLFHKIRSYLSHKKQFLFPDL